MVAMITKLSQDDVNHIIQALGHEIRNMRYDHQDGSDNFDTILSLFCWLCHSTGDITLTDELPF